MREYKGKRVDDGKWVYGSLLVWSDGSMLIHIDESGSRVIPETIGQHTGHKDIYEGDIVEATNSGMGQTWKHVGEVCYGWHCASWNLESHTEGEWYMGFYVAELDSKIPLGWRDYKVIGNIHDTEEK